MINSIHERLLDWSDAIKGGIGAQGYGSVLGKLVAGDEGASSFECRIPFSVNIEDTERAVQSLPDALKRIVIEYYVNDSSTLNQKLKALSISKPTLYRRLGMAHELIQLKL